MATLNLGRLKPVFRSTWNSATAYNVDDIVVRNNQSYISIQAGTNQDPATATAYWTLMAAAGTDLGATLANKEIAFKTNAGALDGIPMGTAGQFLKVNSGATGYEFGDAGGGVLQVKSTTKTDTQSISASTTRADITGLYLDLTPSSASNKVLVWFNVSHWGNDSHCQIERRIGSGSFSIISPSSEITGSRTSTHSGGSHRNTYELNTANMTILDAPNTTSALRYKITFNNGPGGGQTGYINRAETFGTAGNDEAGISTITAMEIASGVL